MLQLAQSHNPRPHWTRVAGRGRHRTGGGFTFVELLLVVALLLMLASAMVFNFSSLLKGNQLEEGTFRLETLMRYARAQAANSGRKVQLVFNNTESTNAPAAACTGEVRATWEPDPLGQPGWFEDLTDAQFHVQEINDLVQVESVKLLDASTACPATDTPPEEDLFEESSTNAAPAKAMAPITFYPDGSSDSAEIIVAARSVEEEQQPRMAVRLVGMTGSISHQLLVADLDETLSESGLPERERSGVVRRESVSRDSLNEPATGSRVTPNPNSVDSSSRALPAAPRSTVGETNSVDQGE